MNEDELRLRFAEKVMIQLVANHAELNEYVGNKWQSFSRQMYYHHATDVDEFAAFSRVFDENVSGMVTVISNVSFMLADAMVDRATV